MIRNVSNCLRVYSSSQIFTKNFEVKQLSFSAFIVALSSRRYSQLSISTCMTKIYGRASKGGKSQLLPISPDRLSSLRISNNQLFIHLSTPLTTTNRTISYDIDKINTKKYRHNKNMGVFKFSDYDCVGFDLDNTLLRYNVTNMVTLEYECLSTFLVEKRGYDPKYLYKKLDQSDFDFMQKGLVLDFAKGNIIRTSPDGFILRASHGTKLLSEEELDVAYPNRRWNVTDAFTSDLLVTWNGPLSEKMRTLLDYFDMPASLAFARIIDTLDEKNGAQNYSNGYNIWPDVLDGLIDMFSREHFATNQGKYFPALKGSPSKYLHRSSPKLISWLKDLKKTKVTYLITGSNSDFADFTASYAFGNDWRSLFDIVICYAKKPGFFTSSRPFLKVADDYSESDIVTGSELKKGEWYSQGNWKELKEFFAKETGKSTPVCLYVGDNLIQDIYTPKYHVNCDTVAVVEEQLAEGMVDHSSSHCDEQLLNSKIWGSYFRLESKNKYSDSLWSHVINNYSKICVPTVEFLTENSLDMPIKSFGIEDNKKLCGYYPAKPKSVATL